MKEYKIVECDEIVLISKTTGGSWSLAAKDNLGAATHKWSNVIAVKACIGTGNPIYPATFTMITGSMAGLNIHADRDLPVGTKLIPLKLSD